MAHQSEMVELVLCVFNCLKKKMLQMIAMRIEQNVLIHVNIRNCAMIPAIDPKHENGLRTKYNLFAWRSHNIARKKKTKKKNNKHDLKCSTDESQLVIVRVMRMSVDVISTYLLCINFKKFAKILNQTFLLIIFITLIINETRSTELTLDGGQKKKIVKHLKCLQCFLCDRSNVRAFSL